MKVLILGGGIAGLLANWAFKKHGHDVVVLEPNKPGGEFLAGGLKYLNRTNEMLDLLHALGLVFTNYSVQGGVLLQNDVAPYPAALRSMKPERATRIQHDHWRKTRRTEPDKFAARSMNDPESVGSNRALRTDLSQFVRQLAFHAHIEKDLAKVMTHEYVEGVSGRHYRFDAAIVTIPLWVARHVCPWLDPPPALALRLNIAQVQPFKDRYSRWDYVYTPYTPEGLVHRFSPKDGGYSVEFNGDWVEQETNLKLTNELNFLFPEGWALDSTTKGLNGHLHALESQPKWAPNVQPLGRFAEWEPRATTDVVLASALRLAQKALPWND